MVSQRIASVKSKSLKRAKRNHLLKDPHRSFGVAASQLRCLRAQGRR
jgi:hypothetical protein